MNNKMIKSHNYQQLNLINKNKNKLSKQPEQEQNQINGHQMKGFHWGGEMEE